MTQVLTFAGEEAEAPSRACRWASQASHVQGRSLAKAADQVPLLPPPPPQSLPRGMLSVLTLPS